MDSILYRGGYKYQLIRHYCININIFPDSRIESDYISLSENGKLWIYKGYAWDGPSGPTIDTLTFMRGSLVHDAIYQLIREGFLNPIYRKEADQIIRTICVEDGMSKVRAWWVYTALRAFGGKAIKPSESKPVVEAPKESE